jgi:hypothetical protein
VNHALYTRLLNVTVQADLNGLAAMNAAASTITGATIDPPLYAAGKALRERSHIVSTRLRKHFAGTNAEPSGDLTGYEVAKAATTADPNAHHVGCICQRMYDEGRPLYTAPIRLHSGKVARYVDLDAWCANELTRLYKEETGRELEPDWFKATYDALAFGQGTPDKVLTKVKNRLEAQCPAAIHYPRLLADQMVCRDVYCSTDAEKEAEARDGMESDWYDQSHPWETWARFESKGQDAQAGESDVLTRQRNDRIAASEKTADPATLTLSSDVETAVANAERAALRTIRRDGTAPSAWTKLVWANKRRARSKEESARREIKRLLVKLDKYDDPATIEWVKASVEQYGYAKTADRIWKARATQLIRPKVAA